MMRTYELDQFFRHKMDNYVLIPTLTVDCDLSLTAINDAIEVYDRHFNPVEGEKDFLLIYGERDKNTPERIDLPPRVAHTYLLGPFPRDAWVLIGIQGMVMSRGA